MLKRNHMGSGLSDTPKQDRWFRFGLLLTLILAFALRVYRLAGHSLWWDEIVTVATSTVSFEAMFDYLFTIRSHMPLYFIVMNGWIRLGESEFILRYFSLAAGVLTVALIAQTGRLIGGWRVGLAAGLLLAISPFNIWYSQETRMYSLIALATLAATWFLLRIINDGGRREWIGYAIAMFIAVYSHYLAIFVLVAHYIFFSIHHRLDKNLLRKWLIYGGSVGLLFAIWIVAIMLTGGFTNAAISWIAPARWYEPLQTIVSLSIGPSIDPAQPLFYAAALVYMIALVAGMLRYLRRPDESTDMSPEWRQVMSFRLLLLWLAVPILFVFLISVDLPIPDKRSLYMDRYLIISLPALNLLGAWGLAIVAKRLGRSWLLPAGLIIIIITSAVTLRNLYFEPQYARDDWRQAMEYMDENWQENDVYVVKPSQTIVLDYYGHEAAEYDFVPYLPEVEDRNRFFEEEIAGWVASVAEKSDRAWLFMVFENTNPHGFPQVRNEEVLYNEAGGSIEEWMDENCLRLDQWLYTGVRLTLYDLNYCQT
jgi:mannosyltransferase